MIHSKWFVRRLGFVLCPEEGLPIDPASWAMDQIDAVQDTVGVLTIPSDSKSEIGAWPKTFT
jgi:hypothetical protein